MEHASAGPAAVPEETAAEPVAGTGPVRGEDEALLGLDEAVQRVPEELRREMETLLRADFREVQRWTPPAASR